MELIGLIPSFGSFAYTIAAFVIALSVIVAVHEYGHYIVGRWCGIHAEVFSLGFGPVLASWVDRRGTRWQIAALPLGGYVKFLGDADAASGPDSAALAGMDAAERRRSMHAAPLWARASTVAAGPVFNFILSIVVFAAVALVQGQARAPLTIAELRDVPFSGDQALQPGDQIVAIHGRDVPDFDSFARFVRDLPVAPELDYTVRRGERTLTIAGPYPYPPLVSGVTPQSAAMDAGLQTGDVILAVDGTRISSFEDLRSAVVLSEGAALRLTIWRGGDVFDRSLQPRVMDVPAEGGGFEQRYLIGVTGGLFFVPETERLGLFTALSFGAEQVQSIIAQSLSGLYHMITGAISSCNLSGPIGIAETSGAAASQGAVSFIWFIAVLSTAVGLINLFPVPVLDGGHLIFHAYEAITGSAPSDRALRVLMAGGLAVILSLMLFAVTNDLFCP